MSFVGMVRGAASVNDGGPDAVEAAVRGLCAAVLEENHLRPEDVVSAIFTVSPELGASCPASCARKAGWAGVPLFSARARPGAVPGIVEVEAHVRLRRNRRLRPVLLGEAGARRPDLAVLAAAARRPRRSVPGASP